MKFTIKNILLICTVNTLYFYNVISYGEVIPEIWKCEKYPQSRLPKKRNYGIIELTANLALLLKGMRVVGVCNYYLSSSLTSLLVFRSKVRLFHIYYSK